MDPPIVQQAWGCPAFVSDPPSQLVAPPGGGSMDQVLTLGGWGGDGRHCMGRNQIATDVPSQALGFHPQPYATSNLRSNMFRRYADHPVSSSAERSPDADLPLSALDAGWHLPVKEERLQSNLLFCPRPMTTAKFRPIPSTVGDTSHDPLSAFGQASTIGDAPASRRLDIRLQRCVRCRALRKPVTLFIR